MPTVTTETLELLSIDYRGPSIGREWVFRIIAGERVTQLSMRLRPGESKAMGRVVACRAAADSDARTLRIDVREVDTQPDYDDVASVHATIDDAGTEHTVVVPVATRGGDHVEASELAFVFRLRRDDVVIEPTVRMPSEITIDGTSFSHDIVQSLRWPELAALESYHPSEVAEVRAHTDALEIELGAAVDRMVVWARVLPAMEASGGAGNGDADQSADATEWTRVNAMPGVARIEVEHGEAGAGRWRVFGLVRGAAVGSTVVVEVEVHGPDGVLATVRSDAIGIVDRFALLGLARLDGGLQPSEHRRQRGDRYCTYRV